MTVEEAENAVNSVTSVYVMPKAGVPALKWPTFDRKATDKYQEL